jgi:NADPH:quinone reductase-like Zn-dependent oxidoreductase
MLLHEDGVVKAPAHLDALQAAALPCAALAAWNAVVVVGKVKPGDVVLTQGTGGVSLFALQFAKMLGAFVIITSSSDEKLSRTRQLGADETINYVTTPDWGKRAREIAGGDGVDVVIDLAGQVNGSLRAVRTSGTVVLIGVLASGTAELQLGSAVTREILLRGIAVGSRAMFEDMMRAIAFHRLKPTLQVSKHSFEGAAEVIRSLTKGGHYGKICMRGWSAGAQGVD